MSNRLQIFLGTVGLLGGLFMLGCTAEAPVQVENVPTLAPIFQSNVNGVVATATPTAQALVTRAPTATSAVPTPTYREVLVYDEQLAAGWTTVHSENVILEPESTVHWFEHLDRTYEIYSGAISLLITPDEGWGTVRFTLEPDAPVSYTRDQVEGVSFWLNSNNSYMSNDALVVTVVGSNKNQHWEADDISALTEVGYFPEIPLYDLAINDAIPPNTWVRVVLSMDKLLFGPEFEHVTGIIIKTKSFQNRAFHVDRVALLVTR